MMKIWKLLFVPSILWGLFPGYAETITGPSTSFEPFVVPATGAEDIKIYSIVTAAKNEPMFDGYFHTGASDGTAAYDNGDGTFTILVNHEIPYIPSFTVPPPFNAGFPSFTNEQRLLAHGGKGAHVAKWVVNKPNHATDPLKVVSGEDLITSVFVWDPGATGGAGGYTTSIAENFQVFCSADMAPGTAFFDSASGKGTQVRLYLTGEEFAPFDAAAKAAAKLGVSRPILVAAVPDADFTRLDGGRAFAVHVDGPAAGTAYELAAFGNMNFENAVASPFEQEKTVVVLMDDENPGQVYLYVGTKTSDGALDIDKAGLTNGSLYGMQVNGQLDEANVNSGDSVSFFNLGDVRSIDWTEIETMSDANSVTRFSKPEDVAWDTQNANRFYFVTSGGTNPARLWRVTLNSIGSPEGGGTLEVLADGGLTPQANFNGFDNITCDFNGDVFIQEDGSTAPLNLSRVWKYDALEGTMTVIAHHNPLYFQSNAQPEFISTLGETSGILDLSSVLGEGWYLLTSMAHVSGGTDPQEERDALDKLQAYEFSPPFYEESQLMVMFIPQDVAGSIDIDLKLNFDGNFFLTFDKKAGFDYQPQRSPTLDDDWANFGALIKGDESPGSQRVDVVPVNSEKEFYRVERVQAP